MIACALCIGSSREPYVEATLASIASVVDLLVVNDNSEGPNPNAQALEASAFARDGRLRAIKTKFVDFATMRNDAFSALAAVAKPEWVLWLDADEVHGSQIEGLVRGLLPRLGSEYAAVDGYTDHFIGTFDWISDVARRLCVYRFSTDLYWRNAVHEKIESMRGKSFVIPYRYAHYGNVLPPSLAVEKHRRYHELGSAVAYDLPTPEAATIESVYGSRAKDVRRFRGAHPQDALPVLARLRQEWASELAAIDALFRRSQRPLDRASNSLRGAIEETRIKLRYLEHPFLSSRAERSGVEGMPKS